MEPMEPYLPSDARAYGHMCAREAGSMGSVGSMRAK